ncbi:MAG: DEAD/DEAH box helicase, partial [Caulobacteraceae bacterium]
MPKPARPRSQNADLVPGPIPAATGESQSSQEPTAAVAAALAGQVKAGRTWVHLASSERRAEEIGRALAGLAPDIETLVLPPWDCLPYDRASPSRDVMGRRMRVFQRLAEKTAGRRVLVVSPEALMQRLPPAAALRRAFLRLERGRPLDRAGLIGFARRSGYVWDDRIDEPGEIAALGEVIDIFPADALRPVRLAVAVDGVLGDIRIYDPLTQRSEEGVESLDLGPASELIEEDAADQHETEAFEPRVSGAEHRLPLAYQTLRTLFELLPKAALSQDPKAGERLVRAQEQVQEAYEARTALGLDTEPTLRPAGLYLPIEDCDAGLDAWTAKRLPLRGVTPGQRPATAANPGRAFCDLVDAARQRGDRVVLSGLAHELRALNKALRRGLDTTAEPAADWSAALAGPAGAVLALEADLEAGFVDGDMVVIAASDVLGGRLAERKSATLDLLAQADLRIGDVVLHEDHGVGVLRDLTVVEVDGAARDSLQIEYHGGASILAPVDDIGRVWRYGAEEAAVTLDRLKGDGWFKRRAEVSRHVEAAAIELVALAKAREAATCEPIQPPKGPYARFAVRFAYPETQDQGAAIAAVLSDLASGRPMDRLVCGDVGFGKTEVALRAAAAVALSGRQVAVAAPTTVLARQHFQTFQKRFAGTGVKVAQLSRVVGTAEAKAVRAGLASGEIGLVIGTHALASEGVDFANLGLVIIDEEQKFGSAMKERLRGLARDGHRLTLTATPIPRTLQAAMVGVQDVSV